MRRTGWGALAMLLAMACLVIQPVAASADEGADDEQDDRAPDEAGLRLDWVDHVGFGLFATGGLLTLVNFVFVYGRLSDINQDSDFARFRGSVAPFEDACVVARSMPDDPSARAAAADCDEADTLESLGWVLLAASLITTIAGIGVVVTNDRDPPARAGQVSLGAAVHPTGAAAGLRLVF